MQKKRRSSFFVISMSLIFCAGVILVAGYFYLSQVNISENEVVLSDIIANQQLTETGVSAEAYQEETASNDSPQKVVTYDLEEIRSVTSDEVLGAKEREIRGVSNNILIGGIWIPGLPLKLGIYKGFGGDNQYLGACTYEERTMGEGNYVLVGHNMANQALLFSPLKRSEIGMLVLITDYEFVYTYKVISNEIEDENNGQLLDNVQADIQEPVLTLVTCHGGEGTDQRTVIRCIFDSKQSLVEANESVQNAFSYR